jgi:diguanylate cyclase (GGDEF)-like protein
MSDTPQPNPERDDNAPDSSPAEPASGSPEQGAQPVVNGSSEQQGGDASAAAPADGSSAQSAQDAAPSTGEPGAGDDAPPTTAVQSPSGDWPARAMRLARGRTGLWAAVAVLCVAAGIVGSVLGAHALAHTDGAKARRTFQRTSTTIAAALKLAIRHEEQLVVSASTFFVDHPHATLAEFAAWTSWARTTRRYPELQQLTLIALVRAPELSAFGAQIAGHAPPSGSPSARVAGHAARLPEAPPPSPWSSTTPAGEGLRVFPASNHASYCPLLAGLRSAGAAIPSRGFDYCAHSSALLASRDSGQSIYTSIAGGRTLAVVTPVYRGEATPRSLAGRQAASVGWLREVLSPEVVMQQVLAGQPGYALRLRYRMGSTNVVFTSGAPQGDAQSTTLRLRGGWTVKSFGAPVNPGVSADPNALVLLIGGCLLSVLLGALVFVLGSRSPHTRLPRTVSPPPPPPELFDVDLYDALTGLPNRALTLDRAERMVARTGRDSGMLAGALFVDIDRLKDVNEKLGPAAGDQLLRIVGERLNDVVRTHDTVGRLGGDEFVVLVESAARGIRLDSLAQRMIAALHQPVELDNFGPSFVLTASIGVAFGRYETHEDMLRDARLALASAKAAGKDRYTLFNANMRTVIEGRAVLEAELNTALSEQQFFLLYQPIYDLGTQRVAGVEALIRWQHPTQGVLAPDDFIPLAEETGLIVPIGRWALEEACNRAAAWQVAGGTAAGGGGRVGVAVKVSATQLGRQGFVTDVRRALQQSGIEAALLTLEIAETAVMRDVESSAERLREIKSLGVSIAIDDFGGSGYAYHSDLRQLPLDCLRVDRGSLAAADDEAYRSWLLEAILLVGRDLSLTVIATGIETAEQMASLQALGFTMAQGFLLGKPTPVDAVEGLFVAGFPAAHVTSTGPALTSPALASLAQAGPAQGQAGPARVGAAQPGPVQPGPAQSSPAPSTPPASQPSDPQPRG